MVKYYRCRADLEQAVLRIYTKLVLNGPALYCALHDSTQALPERLEKTIVLLWENSHRAAELQWEEDIVRQAWGDLRKDGILSWPGSRDDLELPPVPSSDSLPPGCIYLGEEPTKIVEADHNRRALRISNLGMFDLFVSCANERSGMRLTARSKYPPFDYAKLDLENFTGAIYACTNNGVTMVQIESFP